MSKQVLIVNGHPDPSQKRLCAALANAYEEAVQKAGNSTRRIDVGALEFPLIRSAEEFAAKVTCWDISKAQGDFLWADHVVFIYPLWLGSQPAHFKGFLEQVLRYGFALSAPNSGMIKGLLSGRSAHIIVTMGMPTFIYRTLFGAFSTRALERSALRICGFGPIRHTHIGSVESPKVAAKALKLISDQAARIR